MRAVVQRVTSAAVSVAGLTISSIGHGLLVLVAVGKGDTDLDVDIIARKLCGLRVFQDEENKMNLDILQTGGAVLLVSQFTLYGDVRKGNRPSFDTAEEPIRANVLFEMLVAAVASSGIPVCTGKFRAHMNVSLTNDGPVTILLDSKRQF